MSLKVEVLIIGGGFAGVSAAQGLEKQGVKTLLVDKKDYFEVTFANLRNLSDPQKVANASRKKYQDFLTGDFLQTSVQELLPSSARLASGEEVCFEKVIIASGTRYPSMAVAKSHSALSLDERNNEFAYFYQQLKQAAKIMIIGGGVVGVELAGEIAFAMPDKQVTLAHNDRVLLNGFKAKAQRKALAQLNKLGVNVEFNTSYKQQPEGYVDQNTGKISEAELVYQAVGVLPNNEFLKQNFADILNHHGYINVDQHLAVKGQANFYALGDIADVGEAKLGYLAQHQGEYLAKRIVAELKGKTSKAYKRNRLMALIPTGQKTGVVQLPFMVTAMKFLVDMKQKDLFINKIYKSFGTEPNS